MSTASSPSASEAGNRHDALRFAGNGNLITYSFSACIDNGKEFFPAAWLSADLCTAGGASGTAVDKFLYEKRKIESFLLE